MTVVISAAPMAPPTPSGRSGAYGIWSSTATNPETGEQIETGGWGEVRARRAARVKADRAWGEVVAFLDEEDRARDAEERGDADRQEVEFETLGA